MFERYTEKARRIIFFARYEASQFGSPYIETEHLLLGFLREDKFLVRHLFRADPEAEIEAIRRQIEANAKVGKKVSTSIDLPLSNESKRALAFAAEEAERLRDKHIGTEHLFIALLREPGTVAAQVLNSHGLSLEKAREIVSRPQREAGSQRKTGAAHQIVVIHGEEWDRRYIQSQVKALWKFAWHKREWKPLDVVMEISSGRISFDLTLKDQPGFKLQPGGWTYDFCSLCQWELNASGGDEHSIGYTNGDEWLCSECYEKFFNRPGNAPQFDELT